MNVEKVFVSHRCWIGALLVLALISACGGAPTEVSPTTPPTPILTEPSAVPTETPAPTKTPAPPPTATAVPAETAVAEGDFQPLSPAACSDLASAMAQMLGVEVMTAEAPFQDYVSGKAGTGCRTTATGTGLDFESFVVVAKSLRDILEGQGWYGDMMYVADGPAGTAAGFRKANGLCLLSVNWEPSEDADCPPDQPISACQLAPEQQLYSIVLNCAQDTSVEGVSSTNVIKYIPPVPTGEEHEGSCWTNSLTVARTDAWRCTVGNEILDPCFVLDEGKIVVCGADPAADKSGFKLKLTEPLPEPDVPAEALAGNKAWLVELDDGTFCYFLSGATLVFDEKRINYGCLDDSSILGDLQPGPIWTAERVIIGHSEDGFFVQEAETVAIRTVWQ
jgi:hypothetical protein